MIKRIRNWLARDKFEREIYKIKSKVDNISHVDDREKAVPELEIMVSKLNELKKYVDAETNKDFLREDVCPSASITSKIMSNPLLSISEAEEIEEIESNCPYTQGSLECELLMHNAGQIKGIDGSCHHLIDVFKNKVIENIIHYNNISKIKVEEDSSEYKIFLKDAVGSVSKISLNLSTGIGKGERLSELESNYLTANKLKELADNYSGNVYLIEVLTKKVSHKLLLDGIAKNLFIEKAAEKGKSASEVAIEIIESLKSHKDISPHMYE